MKLFTMTEFMRSTEDITHEALRAPVGITKHGKKRLVIMSADTFEKLEASARKSVQAYTLSNAPSEINQELFAGIDAILNSPVEIT